MRQCRAVCEALTVDLATAAAAAAAENAREHAAKARAAAAGWLAAGVGKGNVQGVASHPSNVWSGAVWSRAFGLEQRRWPWPE